MANNTVGSPQHIEELKNEAEALKKDIRVSTENICFFNLLNIKFLC